MLDEKLQETQVALEAEEGKAKSEHRAKLKLESVIQDVEEKLDRETSVSELILTLSSSQQLILLLLFIYIYIHIYKSIFCSVIAHFP